jgi:hypothetical protein
VIKAATSSSPLKELSSRYITATDEKLEVFGWRNAIRITANKTKAEAITRNIKQLLANVHSVTLPSTVVQGLSSMELEEYHSELAKMTQACIEVMSDKLTIRGISGATTDLVDASTPADVARRLILSSTDRENDTPNRRVLLADIARIYAYPVDAASDLSWRNKLRRWIRWSTPSNKLRESNTLTITSENIDRLGTALAEFGSAASTFGKGPATETADELGHEPTVWAKNAEVETYALFGRLLHAISQTSASGETHLVRTGAGAPITVLHTEGLPLDALILPESPDGNEARKRADTVVIPLLPNPNQRNASRSDGAGSLPRLEVVFNIDSSIGALQLRGLRAIVKKASVDVLFPHHDSDAQIVQRMVVDANPAGLDRIEPLQKWLTSAQLNIYEKVIVPPVINLSLPQSFTQGSDQIVVDSSETSDVEYLVGGIEYRRTAHSSWNGWKLSLEGVEAGRADGRRREVRLSQTRIDGSLGETTAFAKATVELAALLGGGHIVEGTQCHSGVSQLDFTDLGDEGKLEQRIRASAKVLHGVQFSHTA